MAMQFQIFALVGLFSTALALPQPQVDVDLNIKEATKVLERAIHGERSCFGGGITCNYADGSK
ncbi:hypothetical protein N0V82_003597 [Gnomoniopsis sp. IMI 355080]|nr:hypothetical protein N0V82_003597 [Gnomoniopsis sp. IMI 355080]